MKRRTKRIRSIYRPYQGRRRGNGWILPAALLILALAAAAWLGRDALLGLLHLGQPGR